MRMSVLPKTPKSKPLHDLRRIVENLLPSVKALLLPSVKGSLLPSVKQQPLIF